MLVRGLTDVQLYACAKAAEVNLFNVRRQGRGFRFQLHRAGPGSPWGRLAFSRKADGERRGCGGVCWHGHRSFMRAVYHVNPEAVIITAMIRYEGRDDFERRHTATYFRMVGPQADLEYYGGLCKCTEEPEGVHYGVADAGSGYGLMGESERIR